MTEGRMEDWPPQWPSDRHLVAEQVTRALLADSWSRGLLIKKFEDEFARFLDVKHVLAVTNATQALTIALQAFGVGQGHEVIIPSLTWPSTAISVLDCGAVPVLADIEPHTYCIDAESVLSHITPRTKAVIPVHLFCSSADMAALREICQIHNLCILEDAAQCHGAKWRNQSLGCIGDAGVFSFHEKKILPCGEGGCIVTNDTECYERCHELRDHGDRAPGHHSGRSAFTGGNYRMSTMHAAVLLARLKTLPELLIKQEKGANLLKSILKDVEELQPLSRRTEMSLQTYYSFCWRTKSIARDNFIRRVREATSVEWAKPYPALSRGFAHFCAGHPVGRWNAGAFAAYEAPHAEKASEVEGVRFPHSILSADVERLSWFGGKICDVIKQTYSRGC